MNTSLPNRGEEGWVCECQLNDLCGKFPCRTWLARQQESEGVVVESQWHDVGNGVWEERIHLRYEDERDEPTKHRLTRIQDGKDG